MGWLGDYARTHAEDNSYMNEKRIDGLMEMLPMPWRYRWCLATGGCACTGCTNGSGLLARKGVTREEWANWVRRHDRRVGKERRVDDL